MRVPDNPQNEATRQALLSAAGPIFARDGFRIARIREIAEVAGANLSAVNYHFGSKQGLYEAVLTHTAQVAIERLPLLPPESEGESLETRFRLLVTNMLRRFVDVDSPSLMAQLMVRELANPTEALDNLVENISKPQFALVADIITQLMGASATPAQVRYCTLSLMGQVVFYLFGRPLVSRLFAAAYSGEQIQALAEHIASFSLAGIQSYTHSNGTGGK
jgi:AcrR family transcriptional regulator